MRPHWKTLLRQNFTKWESLADFLSFDALQREQIVKRSSFPLNLPFRLAGKIEKGTLEDPILKQFLPILEEEKKVDGYVKNPLQEENFQITPKLLKKYGARALILSTSACAMHCRYCFRRHFPYETKDRDFSKELEYLKTNAEIEEVILSGGDPLSLDDKVLQSLLQELGSIKHIKLIRFHTRFPIGIPERVDDAFLALLSSSKKQIIFVLHTNHAKELDIAVLQACKRIVRLGIPVLTQSLLLKGVNDAVSTLKELCMTLACNAIIPYYLHQLDPVEGGAHFLVPKEEGIKLIKELKTMLPGYAVFRYVTEIPGEKSKLEI